MSVAPAATALVERGLDQGARPAAAALERGLVEASGLAADAIAVIAVPAPVAHAAALWQLGGDAVLWEPRDAELAIAGVGVAAAISADGAARFTTVAERAAALWPRLVAIGGGPAPRLLGGFAFTPGRAGEAWASFGDAWFVLPRWTYQRHGGGAWLTVALGADEARDHRRVHAELAAALAALATPLPEPRGHAVARAELAPSRWRDAVEGIRAEIGAGRCRKVVAARARRVELARPIDAAAVLAELGRRHPECTRFGVRRGGVAFVGASPERLVRRRGDQVDAEALAGSIARGGDDARAGAELLASSKDRGEHDLVVRAIEHALAPWCHQLEVPAAPTVRTLRHVLHLHTPVHGTLFTPRHVLALAAALHPTPAVGGTPTAAALDWIARHEPTARGWYAAPVGWFDAAGDGDLTVAIRSGLLEGVTATLYAGAGIVRDSDASAEWAETEVKLRALSGALGLDVDLAEVPAQADEVPRP